MKEQKFYEKIKFDKKIKIDKNINFDEKVKCEKNIKFENNVKFQIYPPPPLLFFGFGVSFLLDRKEIMGNQK